MNPDKIEGGMRDLEASLQAVKTQLAWLDLDRSEQRPDNMLFTLGQGQILSDLRAAVGHFYKLFFDLIDILDGKTPGPALPERLRLEWRDRALRLDQEFKRLNLPKGF